MSAVIYSLSSAPPQYQEPFGKYAALSDSLRSVTEHSPEQYADTLARYLKDPQTQARVAAEARKGLRAIRQTKESFPTVLGILRDFDAVSTEGRRGQLFAPEWQGLNERFDINLQSTEALGKTAKAAVDYYVETIVPLYENPKFTMEDKEKKVDEFLKNITSMKLTVETVERLVLDFVNLNDKITVFRSAFIQIMVKEGETLSSEYNNLQAAVDEAKSKKRSLVPFSRAVPGFNPFGAVGMFSPVAASFMGIGVVQGDISADDFFRAAQLLDEEINNRQTSLENAAASGSRYEALRPHMDYAADEMEVIISLLKSISVLLKELHESALKAKLHLQNAANAKVEFLTKLGLKLSTESFATLQSFLNAFFVNWKEELHWQ